MKRRDHLTVTVALLLSPWNKFSICKYAAINAQLEVQGTWEFRRGRDLILRENKQSLFA